MFWYHLVCLLCTLSMYAESQWNFIYNISGKCTNDAHIICQKYIMNVFTYSYFGSTIDRQLGGHRFKSRQNYIFLINLNNVRTIFSYILYFIMNYYGNKLSVI